MQTQLPGPTTKTQKILSVSPIRLMNVSKIQHKIIPVNPVCYQIAFRVIKSVMTFCSKADFNDSYIFLSRYTCQVFEFYWTEALQLLQLKQSCSYLGGKKHLTMPLKYTNPQQVKEISK